MRKYRLEVCHKIRETLGRIQYIFFQAKLALRRSRHEFDSLDLLLPKIEPKIETNSQLARYARACVYVRVYGYVW